MKALVQIVKRLVAKLHRSSVCDAPLQPSYLNRIVWEEVCLRAGRFFKVWDLDAVSLLRERAGLAEDTAWGIIIACDQATLTQEEAGALATLLFFPEDLFRAFIARADAAVLCATMRALDEQVNYEVRSRHASEQGSVSELWWRIFKRVAWGAEHLDASGAYEDMLVLACDMLCATLTDEGEGTGGRRDEEEGREGWHDADDLGIDPRAIELSMMDLIAEIDSTLDVVSASGSDDEEGGGTVGTGAEPGERWRGSVEVLEEPTLAIGYDTERQALRAASLLSDYFTNTVGQDCFSVALEETVADRTWWVVVRLPWLVGQLVADECRGVAKTVPGYESLWRHYGGPN